MVPAVPGAANFPLAWTAQVIGQPGDILDNRTGGVPDPALMGPSMIQIGTEGGFLPEPVVWPNIPYGFDRDPKSITVTNVKEHNLFLGPAERADVLIDFSAFRGKTIILYNDAGAAVPAADSRLDYYTNDWDQTAVGGHAPTVPGYGPNIRTIMRFQVADVTPAPAYDLAALQGVFRSTATTQGVFAKSQDPILVPQAPYNAAYGTTAFPADTKAYGRIQSTSLTFNPLNLSTPAIGDQVATVVPMDLRPKAIQELFENDYGRMNATLGVELKFTNGANQTTIPYGYVDPVTEIVANSPDILTTSIGTAGDGTQIWKITHNGVDTHPVHFHLFNVQLINRVDWAGVVKPPEGNELGWKETVRMNPLEDCIVALRPNAPQQPFGLPDSSRPLNPMMPLGVTGAAGGFFGVDPNGNPITVTNVVANFGWEYVWHCHILSHEEMDMMRPLKFNVARGLPTAPVLSVLGPTVATLTWTDATPATPAYPAPGNNWGNPTNEMGFRLERADNGGAFVTLARVLANATSYVDSTIDPTKSYAYRVVAYNAAGESVSNTATLASVTPGVNLALGKPAVASTTYPGFPASNTTDGNLTTRWSSAFSNNQWIYVDLGLFATIQRVILHWETAYGQSYKIQVSNDAVTWTDVYSTTTGNGAIDDIILTPSATGRYVRMLGIQRATTYGYSLFEFEVYGTPVNLALGKPAVASTTYAGYPASNTTDGSLTTRWSSVYSNNQWIYVDLGSIATIQRVVLNWEAAYGQSYKIQVSNDAVTWTDVYSTTTGNGAIDDITLTPSATGRYVRMLGIQRATTYGYSLFEFEVYGVPGTPVPVNLALGKTTVASTTYPGFPASNTTDGNPATRWSSAFSNNEWIYVDLGSVATIQRVVLNWETAYGRSYKIQVSNDAVTWTDVYSTTTGSGGVASLTLATPATGRYVRMLGIQRATAYGYSLFEFEVY